MLTITRRLPTVLDAPRHKVPLSDTHRVVSHTVLSVRTLGENDCRPILAPCTVTLADPVEATLPAVSKLIRPTSTDTPLDTLPVSNPIVIITRWLTCCESPVWHRTDVSESHTDRSQLLLPIRTAPDPSSDPSPAPCTVITADPVTYPLL